MLALHGIAFALNCFALLYCLLSALVAATWHPLKPLQVAQQSVASILFGVRVFPLIMSAIITLALVVPSFQLLEPRSAVQRMGWTSLMLGGCALLLIAYASLRVISAQTRTTRVVTRWLEGALPLKANPDSTVTFQSRLGTPPLTLIGVWHPRVLVSESTIGLLSHNELRIALKHEFEHMKSHDNLKKLIFRLCPFPGMTELESAWAQASELAADDAAVSNQSDAVDLASALVKLSRLVPVEAAPVCAMGFVAGSLIQRISRLLAWDEAGKARRVRIRAWFVIPFAVAISLFVTIAYSPVLIITHSVTNWFVR